MRKQALIVSLTLPWMTSCAANIPETNWCDRDNLILISKDDVLTPGTERQILAHNEAGKKVCGW